MNKLAQLAATLETIDNELDALLDNDDLSAEQQVRHDQLVKDREATVLAVSKEKAKQERLAQRNSINELAAQPVLPNRRTDPQLPSLTPPERPTEQQAEYTIPATALRFGSTVQNFKGERHGMTAQQRAYHFGMFVWSSLAADYPKYRTSEVDAWNARFATTITSTGATGAGYLVPTQFSSDMIDLQEKYGVVRQLFRREAMTSDLKRIPRRTGGLTAYFVSEGAAITESNTTWDAVELKAKKLAAISKFTNELNADSIINLGDFLAGEIAIAFATKEDNCGLLGNGLSTYGGIVGVVYRLQNVDAPAGTTDAAGLVAGAGNTWGALTLANHHTVISKLPAYARDGAVWVCSTSYFDSVMATLATAAGGNTTFDIQNGVMTPRFLGFPVVFSQVMPVATAVSTVQVLLGNFKQGAAFGDRAQTSIQFSEHATVGSDSVFEKDEIAIRGTERFDIVVHDVGTSTVTGPICGLATTA